MAAGVKGRSYTSSVSACTAACLRIVLCDCRRSLFRPMSSNGGRGGRGGGGNEGGGGGGGGELNLWMEMGDRNTCVKTFVSCFTEETLRVDGGGIALTSVSSVGGSCN